MCTCIASIYFSNRHWCHVVCGEPIIYRSTVKSVTMRVDRVRSSYYYCYLLRIYLYTYIFCMTSSYFCTFRKILTLVYRRQTKKKKTNKQWNREIIVHCDTYRKMKSERLNQILSSLFAVGRAGCRFIIFRNVFMYNNTMLYKGSRFEKRSNFVNAAARRGERRHSPRAAVYRARVSFGETCIIILHHTHL